MFCKECGTEVPQSARFCPNCGEELAKQEPDPEEPVHEVSVTDEAQPLQSSTLPTPTSLPEPVSQPVSEQSGTVQGTVTSPTAAAASSPTPPAQAPAEQPAPRATMQTPPSAAQAPSAAQMPAAAQPPVGQVPSQGTPPPATTGKKTGTTCLIIGCVGLFMLVVFGVIGFGIFAYFRASDIEVTSEQMQEIISLDDETSGQTSEAQIDGATSAEAGATEASRALHSFLIALEKIDRTAILAAIADDAVLGFDPELWGQCDSTHLRFEVVNTEPDGSGGWEYLVEETLRDPIDGTEYVESYHIKFEQVNGEWLVTEFGGVS